MEIFGAIYGTYINLLEPWLLRNKKYFNGIVFNQIVFDDNYKLNNNIDNCNIINKKIMDYGYNNLYSYGTTDHIRLIEIIKLLEKNIIGINIDIDTIFFKSIIPIINLDYDFIISRAEADNKAWPQDCSEKIGFGACSGFYIAKPKSLDLMKYLLNSMQNNTYNSYTDQETIMRIFSSGNIIWQDKIDKVDNIEYTNKIGKFNDINICVLDFNIFHRSIVINDNNQFGNHFPIKKIGGDINFIKMLLYDNNKNDIYNRIYSNFIKDINNDSKYSDEEIQILKNKKNI